MALLAGNLASLLSVKIKPRHDDYTDQVSRIILVKICILSALVTGIDWFHDNVKCLPPKEKKHNSIPDGFLESVCWINGFYIFPELPLHESGYYGIPVSLDIDGWSTSADDVLCNTKAKKSRRWKKPSKCVPFKKRYLKQYQWIPFCIGAMSLLFYMPYIIFRVVNTDMISLKANISDKIQPLPKYTSAVVDRYLKPMSSAYTELAETYANHDQNELRTVANKHQTIYQTDKNVGIIKQVIASLTKKRIQKLTKTFLTLSLVDMATRVKLRDAEEAEKYLLEMIEDGSIFASIDQQAGIVSFNNNPDGHDTSVMLKKIDYEMSKCMELNEQLLLMDGELQVNPQYVQKVMNMAQYDDGGRADEIVG